MSFFREKQQIIVICFTGLLVGGFVLFRYQPLCKEMKTLLGEQGRMYVDIAKASARHGQLPSLEAQLAKLEEGVGDFDEKLPVGMGLGVFLRQIAELVEQCNLKEQLTEPGEQIRAGALMCMPVNIECRGKLTQIFRFFRELQVLGRKVCVEQVRVTHDGEPDGEVIMESRVVVYYRPKSEI